MKIKVITLGLLVSMVSACCTAFAAEGTQNIPVTYNNIKIIVDGETVRADAEPFIYNGTTYLPVRAVGEAVGRTVKWDGNTNTVYLESAGNNQVSEPTEPKADKSQILYDKNGMKITFTGITKDEYGTVDVNLVIENNNSEKFSINDIMYEPVFSSEVAAGKKAVNGIELYEWNLKDIGVSNTAQIKNVEFSFIIFDTETYDTIDESEIIRLDF